MSRCYYFMFSNKLKWFCSNETAQEYCKEKGVEVVACSDSPMSPNIIAPRKRDTFRSGEFHHGVGRAFSTKNEYESYKKQHGLVEMGNERQRVVNKNVGNFFTDSDLKEMHSELKISPDDTKTVQAIGDSLKKLPGQLG